MYATDVCFCSLSIPIANTFQVHIYCVLYVWYSMSVVYLYVELIHFRYIIYLCAICIIQARVCSLSILRANTIQVHIYCVLYVWYSMSVVYLYVELIHFRYISTCVGSRTISPRTISPRTISPGQYPPGQYPPGQYPPRTKSPRTISPCSNIPPDNIPPDNISSKTCFSKKKKFNSSV